MSYEIDKDLIVFLESLNLDDRLENIKQICYQKEITTDCFKLIISEGFDIEIEKFFKE